MVLSNIDSGIFDKILDNLAHDAPDLNLAASQRNKRTLARLAICCKAFLEPALDHLWRRLDSLFPLLKLLHGFKSSDGIYVLRGIVTPDNWSRFDWYARRVKTLCYTGNPLGQAVAKHVYFRVSQFHSTPLLPSIQHLQFRHSIQNDFLTLGVCLFLSPSLQSVEFDGIKSDKLCGTFFDALICESAPLQSVTLRGQGLSKDTLDLAIRFQGIRSLEIDGSFIDVDWLKEAGALPSLLHLNLNFLDSPISAFDFDLGFKNVKKLIITGPLPLIDSFLMHTSTKHLEYFDCRVSAGVAKPAYEGLTYRVVTRWKETLRQFSIAVIFQEHRKDEFPASALLTLGSVDCLQSVRVVNYFTTSLTDEIIVELASGWPEITELLLPDSPPGFSLPTVTSLQALAERCPHLAHLRIPFNDLAPDLPPLSHGGLKHGLKTLTNARFINPGDISDYLRLGRHIDRLFPGLKVVNKGEAGHWGFNYVKWKELYDAVSLCQTIRRETREGYESVGISKENF